MSDISAASRGSRSLAWETWRQQGLPKAWWRSFRLALFAPREMFRGFGERGTVWRPLTFALVTHLLLFVLYYLLWLPIAVADSTIWQSLLDPFRVGFGGLVRILSLCFFPIFFPLEAIFVLWGILNATGVRTSTVAVARAVGYSSPFFLLIWLSLLASNVSSRMMHDELLSSYIWLTVLIAAVVNLGVITLALLTSA